MGDAKRNRASLALEHCICESGKSAGECCYDGRKYVRQPSSVILVSPDNDAEVDGCYFGSTKSCRKKKSKEHLISRAVLSVIKKNQLTVTGLPWQKGGEPMKIGLDHLQCKCLCQWHNSALSPLDTAAAQFFSALERADLNRSGDGLKVLVSGHDVERWMLKTLFNFAHANSLARGGDVLPAKFHPSIDITAMISDPTAWPKGSGLYFTNCFGDRVLRDDEFGLSPLTLPSANEIVGLWMSIQGLSFNLLGVAPDQRITQPVGLYRPSKVEFHHSNLTNVVELSWIDGLRHEDVGLTFQSTVGDAQAKGIELPSYKR